MSDGRGGQGDLAAGRVDAYEVAGRVDVGVVLDSSDLSARLVDVPVQVPPNGGVVGERLAEALDAKVEGVRGIVVDASGGRVGEEDGGIGRDRGR